MWLLVLQGVVIKKKGVDFLGKDSCDLTWLEIVMVMVSCGVKDGNILGPCAKAFGTCDAEGMMDEVRLVKLCWEG